jgi:hypothetical protein
MSFTPLSLKELCLRKIVSDPELYRQIQEHQEDLPPEIQDDVFRYITANFTRDVNVQVNLQNTRTSRRRRNSSSRSTRRRRNSSSRSTRRRNSSRRSRN